MKEKMTENELELHIQVLEDNLNYWMFESNCAQDYWREICSSILLLERLVDENYRFRGYDWTPGNEMTISELKADYISTLEYEVANGKGFSADALEFAKGFLN